jgi:LPPG:FO 2-phospho-L-lactate transferase
MSGSVLALAGGVGGARLARGLAAVLPPEALTIVVNTADDFEHLGLSISPDLDTVMYTLAGLADEARGWGLRDETWRFMEALERLGGPGWFRLGDADLATHVERTRLLASQSLSEVTAGLCRRLGVRHAVVPMSDATVRTVVRTVEGALAFQDYFVRRRAEPACLGIAFEGLDQAAPSAGFLRALEAADLAAVVVCPSNPWLSIKPILDLPGVRARLAARRVPVVAVSPFIGGRAVKGPAAKLMHELGGRASPGGLAAFYGALLDGLVIDEADAAEVCTGAHAPALRATRTLMRGPADAARLAREVLALARELATGAVRSLPA